MKMQTMVVAAFMVGCVAGAALKEVVPTARAAGSPPPGYEYLVENQQFWGGTGPSVTKKMNDYAAQGWRFVGNYSVGGSFWLPVFERPLAAAPMPAAAPAASPAPAAATKDH